MIYGFHVKCGNEIPRTVLTTDKRLQDKIVSKECAKGFKISFFYKRARLIVIDGDTPVRLVN
jgi:hypothetical protein